MKPTAWRTGRKGLRDLFKDCAESGAFLAQTSLVDGVLTAGREMGEDLIAGADDAFVRAYRKSELCHDERDADRTGDDGFAAAVRTGQHIDHAVFVEGKIVRDHGRIELGGDNRVAQCLCREFLFRHRCNHRRDAFVFQLHKQIGRFGDKLDLRHHADEKIRVLQNIHLDDLFP